MSLRTNFKAVMDKLKRTVKATATEEQMRELADKAVEMIQIRTRLGYGVPRPGAKRERLNPLSDGYVEHRKDSRSDLSSLTEPGRSNLTFSGQMIESLDVTKTRVGGAVIEPTGKRRGSGLSNQDVATFVTNGGRPFISLSDMEIKKLRRYFEKDILGKTIHRQGLT